MASKKKFITLSMGQRLKVLEDLKTLHISIVASKYNVDDSTIRRIKRNAEKIMEFANKDKVQKQRRRIRRALYEDVEERLLTWFIEKRTLGDFVSDTLLIKKAAELRDTIGSCSNFKVSEGWLAGFKKRHSIRLIRAYDDCEGPDEDGARQFLDNLQKLMKEEGISGESIYNMEETGLLWKALPAKRLAEGRGDCDKICKSRKERITVALCANASGTHKLMPLVINKYENPRSLKHCKNGLSVIFKTQSNVRMTQSLFSDWYENSFKPSVVAHHSRNSVPGKVILLVGSYGEHRVPVDAREIDHFKILYMPSNTTSLVQPMEQGIISKTKMLYRHKMLRIAATHPSGVHEFQKDYSMKDCIELLDQAWMEVSAENIKNAWKGIVPVDVYRRGVQQDTSIVAGENSLEMDVSECRRNCEETERKEYMEVENDEASKSAREKQGLGFVQEEPAYGRVQGALEFVCVQQRPAIEYRQGDLVTGGIRKELAGECAKEELETESAGRECDTAVQRTIIKDERDENRDELQYLFQRLEHYVSGEAIFIQQMFQVFRNHFLGNE